MALAVRRIRADVVAAGHLRAFVPGDPEPVQVVDDVRSNSTVLRAVSVSSMRMT